MAFKHSSVSNSCDSLYDFPCTDCEKHGLNSEALYCCPVCKKHFCSLCVSQHDRFHRNHSVLGYDRKKSWCLIPKQAEMCKMHEGEDKKMYCVDHNEICCLVCITTVHRSCKDVQHIPVGQLPISSFRASQTTRDEPVTTDIDHGAVSDIRKKTFVRKILKKKINILQKLDDTKRSTEVTLLTEAKNVRLDNGKRECCVTGLTRLTDGHFAIVDNSNRKLKLLNATFMIIDHVNIPAKGSIVVDKPWNVCLISDSKIAVTVVGGEIKVFNVRDGKFERDSSFRVKHDCLGIAHWKGRIYITSGDTLFEYTTDGEFIREIYKDKGGGSTVNDIAISIDGSRLYVTDLANHRLVTLNMSGKVVNAIQDDDVELPNSVCVSQSGKVFVCRGVSHSVIEVDKDGKELLNVVADQTIVSRMPHAIFFDDEASSILLGLKGDHILVMKFK